MKPTLKNFLPLIALLLCVSSVSAFAAPLARGDKAPDFSLQDQQGKITKLSDFAGKVVVLEWTNPDCPFVRRHYKEGTMKALQKKYSDRGVAWIAINSSHFATDEANAGWVEAQQLTYPVLNDSQGSVGKAYGAKTTPHMFVIGKDGALLYEGAIDNDASGDLEPAARVNYVEQALAGALDGQQMETASTKPYGCSVKYR